MRRHQSVKRQGQEAEAAAQSPRHDPELALPLPGHGLCTAATVPGRCSCPAAAAALSHFLLLVSEH